MKTKSILITLIAILTVSFFVIQSCKKDEEKNQTPDCEITNPKNGQEIVNTETIIISVEANDSDGSISEVRFEIDGIGKGSSNSYPYNYSWETNTESIGEHSIKATSIDNQGGKATDEISVTIIESINNAPLAYFIGNPTTGTVPLTVNFTDQSTNNPTNWEWNFGDGTTSIQANPIHIFNTAGSYTVSLTVNNAFGTNTESKADYIIASGTVNTAPNAMFTVSPISGNTSTNFAFDASACSDNEDPTINLQVRWDFDGDGAWDMGWNTNKMQSHQYSIEDTYTAKVEVKDTEGLTDEYSQTITVISSDIFVDPRDGQHYGTKIIGSQIWFTKNLNYETTDSWWYDNSSTYGEIYGRLYTWDAALDACPEGWHLPTDYEWKIMEMALGMSQSEANETGYRGTDEGTKLKATSGWADGGNGNNSSGFTGLPGGYMNNVGSFYSLEYYGTWWSSSKYSGTEVWSRRVEYSHEKVVRYSFNENFGRNIRCLKN